MTDEIKAVVDAARAVIAYRKRERLSVYHEPYATLTTALGAIEPKVTFEDCALRMIQGDFGSFMAKLGELYCVADSNNRETLKLSFKDQFSKVEAAIKSQY